MTPQSDSWFLTRFANSRRVSIFALGLLFGGGISALAQGSDAEDEDETIFELSPFEVTTSREDGGYMGDSTLAGNRLNTQLRDIGNAVSVISPELLKDIGAVDNTTLLQYTPNTEVGGVYGNYAGLGDSADLNEAGNFTNPNSNTRIRGLTAADNTRDFFKSDVPWDGYNIAAIDLQRGPNSILFGQGKPSGIINARTQGALFDADLTEFTIRYGSYGSLRASINTNQEVFEDELAVRFAALHDNTQYQQEPAFSDSQRAFGAVRWEPSFLKTDFSRTIFKANTEVGSIESNRPRSLPPYDRLTPWFADGTYTGYREDGTAVTYNGTNQATYEAYQLEDTTGSDPTRGNASEVVGPASASFYNPGYNPWLGPWRYENVVTNFDTDGRKLQTLQWEPRTGFGISPRNGAVDGSVGGVPFDRPATIATYQVFTQQARLPYYDWGLYKNLVLTDASVFDFYNNLIDGPNKKEWNDFRVYNLSLAQTFFRDKVGAEVVLNREDVTVGQSGMLSQAELLVDVMSQFPDGSPNPNLGRPFIFGIPGNNNERETERRSSRVTVFVNHDFRDHGEDSLLARLLGEHTLTGLLARDSYESDFRQWQSYRMGSEYIDYLNRTGEVNRLNSNSVRPATVIYLGESLLGKDTAAGANIPRPSGAVSLDAGTLVGFDSTWIGSSVRTNADGTGYGDEWLGPNLAGNPVVSTQSENPANYVGFTNIPYTLLDAEDGDRDLLTYNAELTQQKLSSKALVWQGKMLNRAIVATYGWREDISRSWSTARYIDHPSSDEFYGYLNLDPNDPVYPYRLGGPEDNKLVVESRAWTVVAHLNDLPLLDRVLRRSPVDISLFYNESSNFEALSQRVDYLDRPLGPPSGETVDRGIRFETKDGRWMLKVNRYVTEIRDASTTGFQALGAIGAQINLATRWARRFKYAMYGYAAADMREDPYNEELYPLSQINSYRYTPKPGQYQDQAAIDAAREAALEAGEEWVEPTGPTAMDDMWADVGAYYSWLEDPENQAFFEAWGFDPFDLEVAPNATMPQGMAIIENNRSEGWEIEFSGLPVPNWRITLNASQTEAERYDVGGADLIAFMDRYQTAMDNTRAGDLRIWWGDAQASTARYLWNQSVGANWALARLGEGTAVAELREWRVNLISNYRFTEGALKGYNFGGAIRYQSSVSTGYAPLGDPSDTTLSFDVEHPYRGPSETNFDFWIGYQKAISERMNWRIQLNVRNAFQGKDELIPITVQWDGSPAAYRIAPKRTFEITSTLEF